MRSRRDPGARDYPGCIGDCCREDTPREGPGVEDEAPLGAESLWGTQKREAEKRTLARRASWPEEPKPGPGWLAAVGRTAAAAKETRAAVPVWGRGFCR